MTAIRVKCPSCGHVDLGANEISLHLHPSGDRGAFGFTCPECTSKVDTPAGRKVVALLIAAGVEPVRMHEDADASAPAPMPIEDRNPDPSAEPFTLDDVIAFHFLLEDDGAIAELFALGH
jgi:hypothetical protein